MVAPLPYGMLFNYSFITVLNYEYHHLPFHYLDTCNIVALVISKTYDYAALIGAPSYCK